MPHIHTKPGQHDHTVSAYIIRTDGSEPRILLHRHKKLGVYMQFGGHVELNENPWQAITHELKEESGYSLSQLAILQPQMRLAKLSGATAHPQPVAINTHAVGPINDSDQHYHTDAVYAFVTTEAPSASPDDGESADMRLFTRDELAQLGPKDIFDDVREITLFVFDGPLRNWDKVPAQEI